MPRKWTAQVRLCMLPTVVRTRRLDVQQMFGKWLSFVMLLGLAACDDSAVGAPTADILISPVDADDDASLIGDKDALADASPEQTACIGSNLDPAFSAFDNQCAFLDQCEHMGSCYCGDGCPANKVKCDAQYCPEAHPKCYCGDGCDAKLVMCPNYVCNAAPKTGCEPHDDCVYNNQKPPAWCGCQKMPNHCSCGSDCLPNVPLCDPKVCKNYPAKGCTANTTPYANCYCDRCGTLAHKSRCYFLLCPDAP